MNSTILLRNELKKREKYKVYCEDIKLINECPVVFITEYFNQCRNEVDLYVETLLHEKSNEINENDNVLINKLREEFIFYLKVIEDQFIENFFKSSQDVSEFCGKIIEKYNLYESDCDDYSPDKYHSIYKDMFELKSKVLSDKMVLFDYFKNPVKTSSFGQLIVIDGCFMDYDLEFIK